MDRQIIEFDEKGIKVYTDNGFIENNGKTTHTAISGEFYMSADSLVRLLAHFSESTFVSNTFCLCETNWRMITSDEKVKTLVEAVTKSKEHSEEVLQQKIKNLVAAADELDKEKKQLQKLIEDHNRGCVGLFHKKIKL